MYEHGLEIMVVLSASGVCKSYGITDILKDVSFSVEEGDKVGILGVNGAGKTTLFRLITGQEQPDSGEIYLSRQTGIAYMQQHAEYTSDKTAEEEVLTVFADLIEEEKRLKILERQMAEDPSAENIQRFHNTQERFIERGGMTFRGRTRSALKGLGFSDEEIDLPLNAISGGQRTRALIAKLLLGEAKLLLLDEPTNHLDVKAIAWMEEFLAAYKGTVLVISHDRFFLDKITNKIFEVENCGLKRYNGNYSQYIKQKEQNRIAEQRAYEQKRREVERLQGIIEQQKRWNREKNLVTARSKQKAIDRIEADMVKPAEEPEEIKFKFKAEHGAGNDILIMEDVQKSFDGVPLLKDVNLHIKRGQRVFLLGDNGCGKTTLMRIIMGQMLANSGECELGARVITGYYDQAQSDMLPDKSALDTVYEALPHMTLGMVRSALAAFLFKGDDVYKKVGDLSGGERARVALCRLMLSKCNFLLLDEPTNHLDIASKEALENALGEYDGTMLMISHDRYFINKLADKIYAIENGTVKCYNGNYDYYLTHRTEETAEVKKTEKAPNEYQKRKEQNAALRKLKARAQRAEKSIGETEERIAQLEQEMAEHSADYEKVIALSEETAALQEKLAELYEEWETCLTEIEEQE